MADAQDSEGNKVGKWLRFQPCSSKANDAPYFPVSSSDLAKLFGG